MILIVAGASGSGKTTVGALLNSQFDALEPPQPGEPGVTVVPSGRDPAQTVAAIIAVVRGAGKGQSYEAEA